MIYANRAGSKTEVEIAGKSEDILIELSAVVYDYVNTLAKEVGDPVETVSAWAMSKVNQAVITAVFKNKENRS